MEQVLPKEHLPGRKGLQKGARHGGRGGNREAENSQNKDDVLIQQIGLDALGKLVLPAVYDQTVDKAVQGQDLRRVFKIKPDYPWHLSFCCYPV